MEHTGKRELRRAARSRRAALTSALAPAASSAAAEAVAQAVLTVASGLTSLLPPDAGCCLRVAAYESLPDEPPTGPLIEALLAAGHQVIVPVTLADWSLQWRPALPGVVGDRATVTRQSSASEPQAGSAESAGWLGTDALARVDLVIAPGLSVDRRGTRLGQGGGCYDRALAHRHPSVPVLTLLHEGEVAETDLPCEGHDVPVDGFVTTTGRVVWVTGGTRPEHSPGAG